MFPDAQSVQNTTLISEACLQALQLPINCSESSAYYPNDDYAGPFMSNIQQDFCGSSCSKSLHSISSAIHSACHGSPDPWENRPAAFGVDRLWAYQNRTCLKDPVSNEYCTTVNAVWYKELPDEDIAISALPKQHLCSPCHLGLLKELKTGAPYSNWDDDMARQYQAAQNSKNHRSSRGIGFTDP